jgi:hypothetical protein
MGKICKKVAVLMAFACAMPCIAGGGTKLTVFEKRLEIASTPARIFAVISDIASYPNLCPKFHNQVSIISSHKKGLGVVFDNVAKINGRSEHSRWTVSEFVPDRLIRMDCDSIGSIIVLVHQVDYEVTEEVMIAALNYPASYKSELFSAFEEEMQAVKAACEEENKFKVPGE